MIQKRMGKRIQKAREEAGLSQGELASLMGCTQAALSNYELGKRRLYLANLAQLARILNKPINFFLEEPEDVEETPRPPEMHPEQYNNTITAIIGLLAELPEEELEDILDFVKWRRDRQE
jgi:transcriptional regulator with XRE-family HTH domain